MCVKTLFTISITMKYGPHYMGGRKLPTGKTNTRLMKEFHLLQQREFPH